MIRKILAFIVGILAFPVVLLLVAFPAIGIAALIIFIIANVYIDNGQNKKGS